MLKHMMKALSMSQKVSFRTDNRGFLSLQFMIALSEFGGKCCFVEFFVSF